MRLFIQQAIASQSRKSDTNQTPPNNPFWRPPFFLIITIFLLTCITFALKPFIEIDKDGKLILAKWRTEKLAKELKDLDEAEQYVLIARKPGWYPCYSCLESNTIYLNPTEVWRYGYTTKSEKGRYNKSLVSKNLLYFVQLEGPITACMKEEKRKIYNYALLPENLKRDVPLIRPPGNKQDN